MKDLFGDPLFGTKPRLLHRTDSPRTSVEAAYSVQTTKREKQMFDAICAHGPHGCISDDLLDQFPALSYSTVTARPSALERKGLIVRGPDSRIGKSGRQQLVMRKSSKADDLLARELDLR
jgi:hypothetical protein